MVVSRRVTRGRVAPAAVVVTVLQMCRRGRVSTAGAARVRRRRSGGGGRLPSHRDGLREWGGCGERGGGDRVAGRGGWGRRWGVVFHRGYLTLEDPQGAADAAGG